MDYSRYYTPPEIANMLVKQLNISPPRNVVDICCGSCNLLYATKKRLGKANLVGVDIAQHNPESIEFFKTDGRSFSLKHIGEYDLVMANPPFDYLEDDNDYSGLYREPFNEVHSSRLEIEMLLANLLLLSKGGTLLIIMPSTFVEAERSRNLRSILGTNYHIKSIIKLPDDTFGTSRIMSYALIIINSAGKQRVTKAYTIRHSSNEKNEKKENDLEATEKITIPQKNVQAGDWVSQFNSKAKKGLNIRRGNISSHCFVSVGIPVLHTAKGKDNWEPSLRYIDNLPAKLVYAEAGDIIVSRIGKSAGQWHYYTGKRIPISDCLYCIKDPNNEVYNRIKGKQYCFPQKGVATRYITMNDFASWVLSVTTDD